VKQRFSLTVVCLLVLGFAAGCSDDDDSSPSGTPEGVQGQTGLCADLVIVNKSMQKVLAINSSSDVQEAEAARDELNLALTEMQEAGEQLTTAQSARLQDTFEAFNSDVDELSSNVSSAQTLGVEAAPLVARGQAIDAAVEEVEAASGCPG